MTAQIHRTESEEETIALGQRLARELTGVVLLIGNLGAGKTTLVKGVVSGIGAAPIEEVSSPTFTLIHEYGGALGEARKVFHIDLYRLETEREVESLGLDDLFDTQSLVLIEWGERFPRLMPQRRTEIRLRSTGDDRREIAVTYRTE